MLAKIKEGDLEGVDIKNLKKRKLVEEKQETYFIIRKGEDYRDKKVEVQT